MVRSSLVPTTPFLPLDDVRLDSRPRGQLAGHPGRARPGADLPRRPAQLPGHLRRPGVDHRRRRLEDLLLLRVRLSLRRQLRPLPADRRPARRHPGPDHRLLLHPVPPQAHRRAPGPVAGRAALPPGPAGPRARRTGGHLGRRRGRPLGGGSQPALRRRLRAPRLERHRRRAGRPLRRRDPPAQAAGRPAQPGPDLRPSAGRRTSGTPATATRPGSAASRPCAGRRTARTRRDQPVSPDPGRPARPGPSQTQAEADVFAKVDDRPPRRVPAGRVAGPDPLLPRARRRDRPDRRASRAGRW